MLDSEFVAFLLIMFLYSRFNAHAFYAQKLLAGLHFWVTPTTTELSQFSRVRRHKRQKKLPPLPEMDQVRLDAVSIMDKHKLRLLAGRHQRLLQWDTFLFVDKMDNLMFILVTVVLAFSWSETWSCVRNQAPHSATSYAVVIGAATALYFLFCIVWMLGFRHSEVRMSLYLGAGATVFAFTAVRYLCGPVLDFPLDAAFLDVSNRTAATLALLTNEQHAAQSSLTAFHVTLTLCAGVLSFLLFLPAMRYSRMYYDALPKAGMFKKILLHASFYGPLFVIVCWVKPLTVSHVVAPVEADPERLSALYWDRTRFAVVIAAVLFRLVTVRTHMQSYLRQGHTNVVDVLVKRVQETDGEVTKEELATTAQAAGRNVLSLICVVTVQFLAPIALLVFLALGMKRGGNLDLGTCAASVDAASAVGVPLASLARSGARKRLLVDDFLWDAMKDFFEVDVSAVGTIVTPLFKQTIAAFFLWWACLTWFVCSALGFLYWELYSASKATRQADAIAKARGETAGSAADPSPATDGPVPAAGAGAGAGVAAATGGGGGGGPRHRKKRDA